MNPLSAGKRFLKCRSIYFTSARSIGIFPERMTKNDQPTSTSLNTILDRTADIFFMTEIFRAMWLTFEVAMRPKVTINYPFEKGPISPRFRGILLSDNYFYSEFKFYIQNV